jgi:competence protein ComEC
MSNARRWQVIAVIAITALVIVSTTFAFYLNQDDDEESELIVRFLNIGHGLSILISTPDGKNILIDAGSFDNFTTTVDFLEELNVPRIDAFIITHPHPDHVSFAADVLQQYDVLAIYMPGNADNLEPEGWSTVMNATIAEGCPVHNDTTLEPGDYLELSDDVTFRLMWIDANATLINNSCIVIRMDYQGTSFLFTADIEHAAEEAMMDLGLDLDVDILQVAHHGVDSGTSAEFLNASTPEIAIISCGQGYGIPLVPQPGVVSRLQGVPIYTTMFNSMVVVEIQADAYFVSFV